MTGAVLVPGHHVRRGLKVVVRLAVPVQQVAGEAIRVGEEAQAEQADEAAVHVPHVQEEVPVLVVRVAGGALEDASRGHVLVLGPQLLFLLLRQRGFGRCRRRGLHFGLFGRHGYLVLLLCGLLRCRLLILAALLPLLILVQLFLLWFYCQ